MSATPPTPLPYDCFVRRVRRRLRLPVISYLFLLLLLPASPYLAAFAWLLRDAGWAGVAEWTRLVWLIGNGAFVVVLLLPIPLMAVNVWAAADTTSLSAALDPFPQRKLPPLLRQLCIALATAVALYTGRIDIAILATYGGQVLNTGWHLLRFPGHTWREAASILPSALVALAILPGSPMLFAGVVALSRLLPLLLHSSLTALLREKRDLRQFLRHEREECGCGPLLQLQTFCAAGLWEEASKQYHSMQADRRIPRTILTQPVARIRAGKGQYEKVLKMIEEEAIAPVKILLPAVQAYLHLDRYERAKELAEAVRQNKHPEAGLATGAVLEAAGNLEEALDWYERQAHSFRFYRQASTHRSTARLLMRLGRYEEACRTLEQAIRCDYFLRREDVENLAECLRRLGKKKQARKVEMALARCSAR